MHVYLSAMLHVTIIILPLSLSAEVLLTVALLVFVTVQDSTGYQTPQQGHFKVRVRKGMNIPDTDPHLNHPDPYVQITAKDANGTKYTRYTSTEKNTENPIWDEYLDWQNEGCQWTNFTVQVWDKDVFHDDRIYGEREYSIQAGHYKNVKHCVTESCYGFVLFDYYLISDGDECSPNPCQNGGTCVDGCAEYTCLCTPTYTGPQCQYRVSRLQVYARNAYRLNDEDSGLKGDSDPYLEVIAEDRDGNTVRKVTSHDQGDESPEWYENLDFGTRAWKQFRVKLWDKDVGSDDALSNTQTIYLPSHSVSQSNVFHEAHGNGYAYFDYSF